MTPLDAALRTRRLAWLAVAVLTLALAGCAGAAPAAPTPTTQPPAPAKPTTAPPPTVDPPTVAPPSAVPPTLAPAASPTRPVPAASPVAASPAPSPSAAAATPSAGVETVGIYLVDVGGGQIGCGDGIVRVERRVAPTRAPLGVALAELLALRDRDYGQSGFYNALYQSDLRVERLAVEGGTATIQLAGQLRLGGVCDAPRVTAQLEQTALQFPTVQRVAITVNGTPLQQALSQR